MRIVRHPTGFTKVVLGSVFGRELRLHIWPNGYAGVLADIHGHRCRVLSLPLVGRFMEGRYVEVDGGDHEVISCADNGNILEDGGVGSVQLERLHLRRTFVPNLIGIDTIHSFQPMSDRLHLTFVIFGRRHKTRAKVFRRTS